MTTPRRNLAVSKPQLRSVSLAGVRAARPGVALVGVLTIGALSIAMLNLLLHILTSTAVYELADLQHQKRELTTTTQILAEEVDSLASQQNLSNSAQQLGMIANANPVFLSIADQQVFGKPKAALNTDGRIAKNLIPNSVMTQTSTNLNATVASADVVATKDVANQKATSGQVISNSGAIPASPTH
jgi:Na+-transporting NADH:ubiquinone oxidoreductase subunit NqrC